MAKIIKTNTQEQALRIINNNLRTLVGVNSLLNYEGEESYGITITAGKQRAFVLVEKSFGGEILQDIRRKLVKETKPLARKNAIVLDGNDISILDNQYQDKESSGLEKQDQETAGSTLAGDWGTHDSGN